VNDQGQVTRGVLSIDDDAAGYGWYSSLDGNVPADRYDLQTTLLHEIGHVMGFTPAHEGFHSSIEVSETGQRLFVGPNFSAALDDAAEHLNAAAHPNDLMNPSLAPGEWREVSLLAADIVRAAHQAWQPGYSATSAAAPLMAATGERFAADSGQPANAPTASPQASVSFVVAPGRVDAALATALRTGLPQSHHDDSQSRSDTKAFAANASFATALYGDDLLAVPTDASQEIADAIVAQSDREDFETALEAVFADWN
jgi:hypothetical protein